MKTCTGERYEGEFTHLAAINGWHGKFGHLNVLKLDHESDCTAKGKHDRVVAFCPDGGRLYCRVDHVWGLGMPSPAQVLRAAKKCNGSYQRGKWVLEGLQTSEDGSCTDFNFKQAEQ